MRAVGCGWRGWWHCGDPLLLWPLAIACIDDAVGGNVPHLQFGRLGRQLKLQVVLAPSRMGFRWRSLVLHFWAASREKGTVGPKDLGRRRLLSAPLLMMIETAQCSRHVVS